ncbi:phage tail sheath C-terminal domain-containing protein [Thermanaerosceptrum fracticalcis]|nr:phage tail sheath C-terminal domain-containing protein [Thermanaerosceptrum fracticalcis]
MGLPQVIIQFQTLAASAVQRSQRGIVALIIKDDTDTTFDTKVYTSVDEIDAADWTATNKDYIEKAFLGTPTKVIVERLATAATDYNAALIRLKNKKWNYLAIPGIASADVAAISTWIKTERDTNKKTFKAVLPNSVSDHEGIINFATDNIKVGDKTYIAAEYCARIAGILAGLPFTRSATYYALPEVESITESADPDADIDAGKLILVNDGAKIKIGRGVNSLTTFAPTKSSQFSKIKIIEAVDLVRDDIRDTFDGEYVGKVINNYDNKILFLAAVNAYFRSLAADDILDRNYDNKAEIDIDAQKIYLQSQGVDTSIMTDQEIKEYNTGSKVFAKASVKFVDAMEDLTFTVNM